MLKATSLPFKRVLVVDDNEQSREGYGYPIEEMGLTPVYQQKCIPVGLNAFVSRLSSRVDAVFSDFCLTTHPNYASHDGDVLVAACNLKRLPAVLCTTYTDVDMRMNRKLLRYIPALLRTNEPDPSVLEAAFAYCCKEIRGEFRPARRPWRTLVRVYDIDPDTAPKECHVIISARSASEKIRLVIANLPSFVRSHVKPGARFHAEVNIGADSPNEVYFDKWEVT